MGTMRPRSFVMLATVAMMILVWSPRAAAQDPPDLRPQLDQLKQRYEQMMHDLQQRIAALEQQLEKEKPTAETAEATVSAAQLAAPKAVQGLLRGGEQRWSAFPGAAVIAPHI